MRGREGKELHGNEQELEHHITSEGKSPKRVSEPYYLYAAAIYLIMNVSSLHAACGRPSTAARILVKLDG